MKNPPDLEDFFLSRTALNIKLNELKEENKVGKQREGLTKEEEKKFFESLDQSDPEDHLILAFWCMGICTGIRGRENFNLCVEDVTWGTNTIGDYIEVKQTVTKNDQGTLNCKGAFRKFKRIFSYSSFKYDPYDIITSYRKKLPPKLNKKLRFWLSINRNKN
ncbi:hypothetical protein M0812_30399 [Anaeramoeba flamelloides]|uniref:Tyr recombinase domain-containing protein n=1 Tax=Anaeramoeba flamelloides TaxID=1746091 RepID=A0AAV8AKF8_9EUKA|nr:hypothetical protein M0812_30399 [Anaeramoeba flamelloides]